MRQQPPQAGTTVHRMMLGARLRRLREACQVTPAEAGYAVRASASSIAGLELGKVPFTERDIADLLMLYGVTDPGTRSAILMLVRAVDHAGRCVDTRADPGGWFGDYIDLEHAAESVWTYQTHLVPTLLQTDDYSRAHIAVRLPTPSTEDLERAACLRRTRKRLLCDGSGRTVRAVVGEPALRRMVGSGQLQRNQLKHLLHLAESATVDLRVLPEEHSLHSAGCGAFTRLRFAQPDLPDIVYVEHLLGALYVDREEDVARYAEVGARLADLSLTDAQTVDLLEDLISGRDGHRL